MLIVHQCLTEPGKNYTEEQVQQAIELINEAKCLVSQSNYFMFLQFMLTFLTMLAAGTFAVVGFYLSTRGEKETLPNGKQIKTGMIFKEWYFFWMKTKGKYKVFYQGEELRKLFKEYLSIYDSDKFHFIPSEQGWLYPHHETSIAYLKGNIERLTN